MAQERLKKTTEKRLKWYGHVMRMKEEHTGIVRNIQNVGIPGKRRRRWQPIIRWEDACKRDTFMTDVGLKEDNTTNSTAWRNTTISYTGDHR